MWDKAGSKASFAGILWLCSSLLLSTPSAGQYLSGVQHLPGTVVYDIIQDDDHYIWMATDEGLVHFDGITFTTITTSEGLPSNEVLRLGTDSGGRLWILTFSGIPAYLENGRLYTPDTQPLLREAVTKGMHTAFFSQGDDVWIASEDYSLIRIRNMQHVTRFDLRSELGDPPRLLYVNSDSEIFAVNRLGIHHITESGTVETITTAACTPGRLIENDSVPLIPCNNTWIPLFSDESPESVSFDLSILPPGNPTAGIVIDDHTRVFGSSKGLHFADARHHLPLTDKRLNNRYITQIMKDAEGNVWASTLGRGVFMFPSGSWHTRSFFSGDYDLTAFTTVRFDTEGSLIAGTRDGRLIRISPEKSDHASLHDINPLVQITAAADWNGRFTAGSERGLHIFDSDAGVERQTFFLPLSVPKSLVPLSSDTLLVASVEGADLFIRDSLTGKPERINLYKGRLTSILQDDTFGFVAGNTTGLHIIENDSLRLLDPVFEGVHLTRLLHTDSHTFIAATNGNGIWRITPNKTERIFADAPELRTVRDLAISSDGALWAASSVCIIRLHPDSSSLQIVDSGNFSSITVNGKMIAYSGMDTVTLRTYYETPEHQIPLRLQPLRLLVDDTEISMYDFPRIPWSAQTLHITTATPYYRAPGRLRYRYRLTPSDSDWFTVTDPNLRFKNLKPGNYQLSLQAYTTDGTAASEQASLAFTIRAPFWQQGWFFVMMLFLAAAAGGSTYRLRVAHIRKKENERIAQFRKTIELEHQALCAMMNPHFIFNVLNSIRAYMSEHSPESSGEYLQKFSRLIRLQLENSFRGKATLSDELKRLNDYVELEKLRLKHPLTFTVNLSPEVEADADAIELPAILLQPFVENAVRHGIQPLDKAGIITVDISIQESDLLDIRIRDNGRGFNPFSTPDNHRSLALKLIEQRLSLLEKQTGRPASLRIQDSAESGTEIRLTVPVH